MISDSGIGGGPKMVFHVRDEKIAKVWIRVFDLDINDEVGK